MRDFGKGFLMGKDKHWSGLVWLTGLSGSGKSTLSKELERILSQKGKQVCVLDGDELRKGLNKDLGFSAEDRTENIRRVGEVAKLFVNSGSIVIAAFISPYEKDRSLVRDLFLPSQFIEVYVKCDLSCCESRDPKGLYKRARAGEIVGFTGIDSPYEPPLNPERVVVTHRQSLEECLRVLQEVVESYDNL